jgi:Zn-dependent protease with chaperone function
LERSIEMTASPDDSPAARVRLPSLSAEAFASPTDRAALANLQKMTLMPLLVRKYHESAIDNIFYVQNSSQAIRCSEKQFPTVYRLMQEASEILEVPEPELYIKYDWRYNANTGGVDRTFITLHSALINSMNEEELLFVIGHEMGHIKCGHLLYQSIGLRLIPLLEALGDMTLGVGKLAGIGLVEAFFEWLRQAEFSGDRAGLLVCQNPSAAFTATMKLGCGSTRFNREMNVDAFLEQARNHSEQVSLKGLTKALVFPLYTWYLDHPQVVFRAKNLDVWIHSGAYHRILTGDYTRERAGGAPYGRQVHCKNCNLTFPATVLSCPQCGADLRSHSDPAGDAADPAIACKSCGSPLAAHAKFCMDCGTPVA